MATTKSLESTDHHRCGKSNDADVGNLNLGFLCFHFLMKIIRKLNITIGLHRSLPRKLLSQCVDNCLNPTQVELFKAYHQSVSIFSIPFSIHLLRF